MLAVILFFVLYALLGGSLAKVPRTFRGKRRFLTFSRMCGLFFWKKNCRKMVRDAEVIK